MSRSARERDKVIFIINADKKREKYGTNFYENYSRADIQYILSYTNRLYHIISISDYIYNFVFIISAIRVLCIFFPSGTRGDGDYCLGDRDAFPANSRTPCKESAYGSRTKHDRSIRSIRERDALSHPRRRRYARFLRNDYGARGRKSPALLACSRSNVFLLRVSVRDVSKNRRRGIRTRPRATDVTQQVSPDARLLSRQDATLAGNLITDIRGRCLPPLSRSLSLSLSVPPSPLFVLVVRLSVQLSEETRSISEATRSHRSEK